jgi:hypothetical protein
MDSRRSKAGFAPGALPLPNRLDRRLHRRRQRGWASLLSSFEGTRGDCLPRPGRARHHSSPTVAVTLRACRSRPNRCRPNRRAPALPISSERHRLLCQLPSRLPVRSPRRLVSTRCCRHPASTQCCRRPDSTQRPRHPVMIRWRLRPCVSWGYALGSRRRGRHGLPSQTSAALSSLLRRHPLRWNRACLRICFLSTRDPPRCRQLPRRYGVGQANLPAKWSEVRRSARWYRQLYRPRNPSSHRRRSPTCRFFWR